MSIILAAVAGFVVGFIISGLGGSLLQVILACGVVGACIGIAGAIK